MLGGHGLSVTRADHCIVPFPNVYSILLIIVIVLASFQSKWIGSLSGLTAFLLIVVLLTFIGILFFLGLSFAPHSLQDTVDRLVRIFEQPRLSLVMNGIGSALWLILAMTQTISAYTSAGCKDPTKDPHADSSKGKKDDFIKELPSFCTTKKAGAIFCWIFWGECDQCPHSATSAMPTSSSPFPLPLLSAACVAMLLVFLHSWRLSRKSGPRIPPFVHPADDGAFAPIADDIDGDAGDDMYARDHAGIPISSRYGEGGDGRYGEGQYGGGYDDDLRMAHAYGMQASNGGAPLQYGRADPFADNAAIPRQSYDYGAYGVGGAVPAQDPYAAIQYQLRTERAPQLPPTYPN